MTLRDFNSLSEAGKDEMVSLWGDYLSEKMIAGYHVMVYKINNFFVEVYSDKKAGAVKRYKGCVRTDVLYAG